MAVESYYCAADVGGMNTIVVVVCRSWIVQPIQNMADGDVDDNVWVKYIF